MSMVPPEAHWRAALAEGRFLLQRPARGGAPFFPPRIAAPGSGDTDLEWIEASGLGHIYSLTWVSQKPPTPPYNVAIVELDEGPRLMSQIEDVSADSVAIGRRVRAEIVEGDEGPLLVFRLADA